ncbi:Yip1 family protein [Neobacillus niacini]|uniref:Yip1 family protein n=1 Tax=Neobacillus niacini TaxID=86668 RepID=UPI002FFEC6E0
MESQTEIVTKGKNPSLIGMFTSPGEQFERIKQVPKIWVPLLIVSILYVVGMTLIAMSMDVSTLIGEEIPKEQVEIVLGFAKVTMIITGIITPIFAVLISSAIQLIITKIASSPATFKQLFSMNTYIMVIGAVGLTLNAVIRYVIGGNPEISVTSLAGLLNQEKAGILSSFEVFSIWATVVTAIGLHKTAQLSKGLAWTIAIVFFLIGIGFTFIGSLF